MGGGGGGGCGSVGIWECRCVVGNFCDTSYSQFHPTVFTQC